MPVSSNVLPVAGSIYPYQTNVQVEGDDADFEDLKNAPASTLPKLEVPVHPFNVTELLELVLIHSDSQKDLLHWQRVSKFWRSVICESQALQKKLLFRSDLQAETWTAFVGHPGLQHSFVEAVQPGPIDYGITPLPVLVVVRPNPLLLENLVPWSNWDAEASRFCLVFSTKYGQSVQLRNHVSSGPCRNSKTTSSTAPSWRHMFLGQPPPKMVSVEFTMLGTDGVYDVTVALETGVTLGQIHDAVQRGCKRAEQPRTSYNITKVTLEDGLIIDHHTRLTVEAGRAIYKKLAEHIRREDILALDRLLNNSGSQLNKALDIDWLAKGDSLRQVDQAGVLNDIVTGKTSIKKALRSLPLLDL